MKIKTSMIALLAWGLLNSINNTPCESQHIEISAYIHPDQCSEVYVNYEEKLCFCGDHVFCILVVGDGLQYLCINHTMQVFHGVDGINDLGVLNE